METADSGDCNTNLDLGLGFRHELGCRLGRKKLKHGRSDKLFPFLALGFPEPNPRLKNDDDDDDSTDIGDRKRSDEAAVASSFMAVSSPMFSQASRLSDEEDEEYSTTPSPRKKLRLSKYQISALEDTFKLHSTLNPKQKQELAAQLKLLPRQVEVWFQNRRARVKVKQTEIEREELRKSCESLKEENTRLKKEVMQLKSMKKQMTHLPFLMHIGSPICPSCACNNYNNASAATTSFFSSSTKIAKLDCLFVNP